jgi:uncharacterized membrane protein YhhN
MQEKAGSAPPNLRLLSLLLATAYLVSQAWQPYPASFALKGLCVAILAAIAFRNASPVLGVALALSSAGDVLLDLDPERLFVYGLGLFLLVHLIYVFLFVQARRGPLTVPRSRVVAVILVLAYCGGISAWLLPSLGSLMAPVAIYMCAITAMVVTAVLAGFSRPGIVWGAMLFLASDSLLAVNKFKTAVPYRAYLVWATYYLGQYSIAIGFLNEKRRRKS